MMYRGWFFGLCVLLVLAACSHSPTAFFLPGAIDHKQWSDYLGAMDSSQYSALDQINRSNVKALKVAWSYAIDDNAQSFGNPIVVARTLYMPSSWGVMALDAATGELRWKHAAGGLEMRGLAYWRGSNDNDGRIFYALNDRLHALDANTGEAVATFGENGSIDLKEHMDRDPATIKRIQSRSPPRVFENLLIVGSTGGDEWNGPPGNIRAFDARSGKLMWVFHTIPRSGEANVEDWPNDAWKTVGGVNNWSEMTLDAANGILFIPLASAKYNFYGVNRSGNNLYANSLVALDARTGKRLWHFQTVHHDLWDYDLPQAPKLLTLNRDGRRVEAVAQATKTGFVFTFERKTGKPVFPIEERPVPQSDVEGEQTAPTQPFPIAPLPFSIQRFSSDDLAPYLGKDEREKMRSMLAGLRNEGIFTPPSLRGSLQVPGDAGGTSWGNGAVDPATGRLFIVSIEVPSITRLEDPQAAGANAVSLGHDAGAASVYTQRCVSCHGTERKGQPPMIPPLLKINERLSAKTVADIVNRGRGPMPSFALNNTEREALLRELGFNRTDIAAINEGSSDAAIAATEAASPIKYKSGYNFLFSRMGLPANKAPWSQLTAYDMNTGTLLWQKPFGEMPGFKGAGSVFPRGTIAATAGGLIFAGNQDRKLRAWDMDSGEVVFTADLPSVGGGVPAVYAIDGRQYIAVPAASYDPKIAALLPKGVIPEGRNSLVVFALPTAP
jgi:quinoprotein glucose dehydrogenase